MSRSRIGIVPALAVASLGLWGCAGRGGPSADDTGPPPPGGSAALIQARIRRLTNAEYDASVQALLGTKQALAVTTFPPDARQSNYTLNDAQRVDPVLAKQLADAARSLAAEAAQNGTLARLAPCADPTGSAEACAKTFIQTWGAQAYRRPLTNDEAGALVTVYRAGAGGATYADGIQLIVRATLQSAGFLYLTELGDPAASGTVVALTPYELAASLSYLMAAGPPDQALLDAATSGALATPEGREAQARRLLQSASARDRLVRVVREWLQIDAIGATAKDTTVYPDFAGVRDSMDAESVAFISEVTQRGTGTVGELLGASWSIVDAPLAQIYGVPYLGAGMRTPLDANPRTGILNQGAFLSVFAHASESAPVLRGVAVLRRVACYAIPAPTELNISVTPPVPDPGKTTRDRYAQHAIDPTCQQCHDPIDSIGFTFEHFDGMGKLRATENNQPVNSATTVALRDDLDGAYADSNALAAALAASPTVQACMARQLFRGSAGRSDDSIIPSEDSFVQIWQQLPAAQQGNLVETVIAYVKSPLFAQRRTN
jgi:hypothetical protein